MKIFIRFVVIVCAVIQILFFPSCSADEKDTAVIQETFDAADRPVFNEDTAEDFKLLKPWNYDKPWNASRSYPLVVSLHGSGGAHYAPCIVGNDEEMKKYPSFFLSPTCSDWGSAAAWVRTRMEELKKTYRIDENRVYLMGFSMGGSGSYSFASAYYSEKGKLFAGIVRLAGQSQTSLPNAIADRTSVWYHIGLTDDAARVTVAEQAYQFMTSYAGNAAAKESIVNDVIAAYPRMTKILTKNGIQIMKKSEYTGMGHDATVPFKDPAVLEWLFSQTLQRR